MADDQNQRPYRGNDASQRTAAGSASDPLAELARLIGQNDPFSEFGRDSNKRAAGPRQPEPQAPQPAQTYAAQDFGRQPYGSPQLGAGPDLYHVEGQTPQYQAGGVPDYDVPGYGAPGYEATGFPAAPGNAVYEEADPFPASAQPHGAGDDYYDDVPPNRRRIGILAIAGVFALAVIGTAGAFGYRAIFGSSSSSSPPPVIKAEQTPSKIVPAATNKDAQPNKQITERVNDRGAGERLVSREEQPVVVTTTNATPPAQPSGTGVVGAEPKRIRTIAIKPDQPADASMPPPVDTIPAPTAQPRVISTTPQRPAAAAQPQTAPVPAPPPAPVRQAAPAAEPEQPRIEAPRAARAEAPSANAPLSLSPNAAPARAAPPQRTAAVSPPPAAASSNAGSGVYAVQVSAQRSEEEAQAAFRSLQAKFPAQLGNRQPLIKRVDLGEKGIFFRALVGPFTDSAQANQMCSSLKSAGGSCLVQKN